MPGDRECAYRLGRATEGYRLSLSRLAYAYRWGSDGLRVALGDVLWSRLVDPWDASAFCDGLGAPLPALYHCLWVFGEPVEGVSPYERGACYSQAMADHTSQPASYHLRPLVLHGLDWVLTT